MANAAELRLVLNAVDNASAKINGVTGSVSKLGKASKAGGDLLAGMGIGINSMINPAMLAGQAIGKLADFTKDAIGDWQKYVQQIKEMSLATGTGVEEMSRLVQVADDWGIESGKLQSALVMMNKNGMQPSIENLAKLADKYQETSDKQAYAAELTKIFGRNYAALIPMLAQGGDAIRKNSDAIAANLIVTDKSVKESEEYRKAVDELNDSWVGFKNTIGSQVLPILTATIKGLTSQKSQIEILDDALAKHVITIDEYNIALRRAKLGAIDAATEASIKLANAWDGVDKGERDLINTTNDLTGATENLTTATQNAAMAIYDLDQKAFANEAIRALNQAYEDGAIAEDVYTNKMVQMMYQMLDMDEQSVESTLRMAELKKELDTGQITAAQYADEVKRLYNNLKELDGTTVTTHIVTVYDDRGHGRRQHGGPVHTGIPYTVGEAGPETFVPNQNGVIVPNQNTYNNQQYNFNVHTNAGNNMRRDFNMMKAMAG